MKRIISFLLTITMIFCITTSIPLNASATTTNNVEGNLTYTDQYGSWTYELTDNGEGYKITGYDESMNDIKIPSVINDIPVVEIGESAFSGCSSLSSVIIPDSVTSIGVYSFYCCSSLSNITIPNSVIYIDYFAFACCSNLTSVTISDNVFAIGYYVFSNCTNLTEINVSSNNNYYSSIDGVLFDKAQSELIQYPARKVSDNYIIPDGVTTIGDYAFVNCSALTGITIPDSVTTIDYYAFADCSSIEKIDVLLNNNYYSSIDGVLFDKTQSELIQYPDGKTSNNYIIPNGVTTIGDYAFANSSALTSVTIPNSVKNIGCSAFEYCNALISITIPNSVTTISDYTFSGCNSLERITIPNSVTTIGYAVFCDCYSLTGIIIPDSVTSIGDYAFYNCSSLKRVVFPNSITSVGDYMFAYCSLATIKLPDSINNISDGVFYGCDRLTSIILPNSVTNIADGAFSGCSNLTNVYYIGSKSEWNNISIGYHNDSCINATIYFDYVPPKAGDVNTDGEISVTDVIYILKFLIGDIELKPEQIEAADVNTDFEVSTSDAVKIQKDILTKNQPI